MNRRDVPNLIEKVVLLVDLKNKSLNNETGIVIGWNEERERFHVRLFSGGEKLIKPMNLTFAPMADNKKQARLLKLIVAENLEDFNLGIALFEEIESENNSFNPTLMKINWLNWIVDSVAQKDRRCLPKIQSILEIMIEDSTFPDLIVRAKILLVAVISLQDEKNINQAYVLELLMGCVENHYGLLPVLFKKILEHSNLARRLGNRKLGMFKILKDLYAKSQNMILKKTCSYESKQSFLTAAFDFLQIRKNVNENVHEEAVIIREMLESDTDGTDDQYPLAQAFILEESYEEALVCIERYQEFITKTFGNHKYGQMANCYQLKAECYIAMENKKMAIRAFKKFSRYAEVCDLAGGIADLQTLIRAMPTNRNANVNVTQETNKSMRTKMQCSSYRCKNVETEVGAFKHCSKCRLAYYCSIKCQKKHWKNGHKKECKEYQE